MTTNNLKEERAHIRIQSKFTIFIEILASSADNSAPGNVVICNSLNVSEKGLQVVLDNSIEVETILRICLDMKDREPIFVVGEVIWQQPDTDTDGTRVGFRLFESEDTDIESWEQAINDLIAGQADETPA